jgi:CheY-like chemotaxis protein
MAHVLIVDDEAPLRDVLRRSLERGGHSVVEAGNGKAALQVLSSDPVDLVISDVHMPEMDGLEFLMQMRREHPGLPIITVTAGGSMSQDDVLTTASMLGAVAVLGKPFSPQEVLETVSQVLGDSEA